ncbi:hypothetical protein GCM10010423_46370 [Streptomyces levis]|uniref:Uncharacterized protein n=1 Tax=Streptomyces levis TaxID=285566 RepID=A0ABN3NW67_9ACTN
MRAVVVHAAFCASVRQSRQWPGWGARKARSQPSQVWRGAGRTRGGDGGGAAGSGGGEESGQTVGQERRRVLDRGRGQARRQRAPDRLGGHAALQPRRDRRGQAVYVPLAEQQPGVERAQAGEDVGGRRAVRLRSRLAFRVGRGGRRAGLRGGGGAGLVYETVRVTTRPD